MSRYVQQNLTQGEEILYKAQLHWIIFLLPLAILTYFILPIIQKETTEYVITNKRLITKRGWISLKTREYNLSKVEAINIDQGIIGRIFGYGSIIIVGTGGTPEILKHVAKPVHFRNAFSRLELRKAA